MSDDVLMASSASCPYCTKTVAMSRATLGFHRVHGGACDGSGRAVARLDRGRAVLSTTPSASAHGAAAHQFAGVPLMFEAVRGPDGKVRIQVWDRIAVPGRDVKDGQETVFDRETLGQMIDNFKERNEAIALDANHLSNMVHLTGQPAQALAFYSAFALVWGGQVVRCESVGDIAPTGYEDGLDLSRDGLFGFRSEVTEYGQGLLMNFRTLSPTFTSDGTRRDGTPCGYCLFCVAATNVPHQAGTQITF